MAERNYSGPAFPTERRLTANGEVDNFGEDGMSLRDYFAAHAPAAEIVDLCPIDTKGCAALLAMEPGQYDSEKHYPQVLALLRHRWADAMLKARRSAMTDIDDESDDCDHDWELIDDSFDHEYGTEQILFYRCQLCDAERDYDKEEPHDA